MRIYLCTLYDLEIKIPELWSKDNDRFNHPIGLLLDSIKTESEKISQELFQSDGY